MAASLERMKELEEQVKAIPMLQVKHFRGDFARRRVPACFFSA